MTVKEMIEKLEELRKVYGDDIEVCYLDTYDESEGWGRRDSALTVCDVKFKHLEVDKEDVIFIN